MNSEYILKAGQAYHYPLIIKHLLDAGLATKTKHPIVYKDYQFSYEEFAKRVAKLANVLKDLGVKEGDTVAVMDWDSHRYLEAFFAIPMMGAVLQTVNIRLAPEQIAYTLNNARADIILVNEDFSQLWQAISSSCRTVKKQILLSDQQSAVNEEYLGNYETLLEQAKEGYEFPDLDENTRATTFYTTGTTGQPKGVYFSHRQLVLHSIVGALTMGAPVSQGRLHREDVYMPMTPMFHVHAWGFPYVAVMLGLKQVYPGQYAPEHLLNLITEHQVSFTHCVPTILHMLLNHPLAQAMDFKQCKMIIGGSALSQGLAKAALQKGFDVFTGYGMSETCPLLTIAHIKDLSASAKEQLKDRTRTGYPVALVDIRIVDSDMNDLPNDGESVGEIIVRAPWLTQGYIGNQEASDELWEGGWLHTGDIGTLDPRGMLTVTDRLKDVIKSGGEWISSLTLEDLISQHDAVSEVVVVAVLDEKWGERPFVMVVPKQGKTLKEKEIIDLIQHEVDQGKLPKYAIPKQLKIADSLPRTSVGKLNKKAIRESLAS